MPHATKILTPDARAVLLTLGVLLFGAIVSRDPIADTRLLDDIEVEAVNGTARVRIGFNVPLQYLRHFPTAEGELLNVFMQAVAQGGAREAIGHPLFDEVRRSPKSENFPCFTVTIVQQALRRDPIQLVVQFAEPVHYRLEPGRDGRSIVLEINRRPDAPKVPRDCKAEPAG